VTRADFHLKIAGAGTALLFAWSALLLAQSTQFLPGKSFTAPAYYPASNGVRRLKFVLTGSEYQLVSNNLVMLQNPRLTNYTPDGKVEWTVVSPECLYDITTREVRGNTNMIFRTADERLYISGVGFLWQQTNTMLILSNQSFTWIDKRALGTNAFTDK
jgi:hypothetical protein